jgi:formylglycine-generating enzyme required for sulfatase activity
MTFVKTKIRMMNAAVGIGLAVSCFAEAPGPKTITLALGDGGAGSAVELQLIGVPAGEFMMGASPGDERASPTEEFRHRVRISRPYYLGKTEVTRRQWNTVMPTQRAAGPGETDDGPVTGILWTEAAEFAAILTGRFRDKLPPGMVFRLPTEAEWEYAARAGTTTRFYFGDDPAGIGEYAWMRDNAQAPMPAGKKKPNAWGFHDTIGNVWEWCLDYFQPDHTTDKELMVDPVNVVSNFARAVRGGSYVHNNGTESLRVTSEWGNMYHGKRRPHVGMRLAVGFPMPTEAVAAEAGTGKGTSNTKEEQ